MRWERSPYNERCIYLMDGNRKVVMVLDGPFLWLRMWLAARRAQKSEGVIRKANGGRP